MAQGNEGVANSAAVNRRSGGFVPTANTRAHTQEVFSSIVGGFSHFSAAPTGASTRLVAAPGQVPGALDQEVSSQAALQKQKLIDALRPGATAAAATTGSARTAYSPLRQVTAQTTDRVHTAKAAIKASLEELPSKKKQLQPASFRTELEVEFVGKIWDKVVLISESQKFLLDEFLEAFSEALKENVKNQDWADVFHGIFAYKRGGFGIFGHAETFLSRFSNGFAHKFNSSFKTDQEVSGSNQLPDRSQQIFNTRLSEVGSSVYENFHAALRSIGALANADGDIDSKYKLVAQDLLAILTAPAHAVQYPELRKILAEHPALLQLCLPDDKINSSTFLGSIKPKTTTIESFNQEFAKLTASTGDVTAAASAGTQAPDMPKLRAAYQELREYQEVYLAFNQTTGATSAAVSREPSPSRPSSMAGSTATIPGLSADISNALAGFPKTLADYLLKKTLAEKPSIDFSTCLNRAELDTRHREVSATITVRYAYLAEPSGAEPSQQRRHSPSESANTSFGVRPSAASVSAPISRHGSPVPERHPLSGEPRVIRDLYTAADAAMAESLQGAAQEKKDRLDAAYEARLGSLQTQFGAACDRLTGNTLGQGASELNANALRTETQRLEISLADLYLQIVPTESRSPQLAQLAAQTSVSREASPEATMPEDGGRAGAEAKLKEAIVTPLTRLQDNHIATNAEQLAAFHPASRTSAVTSAGPTNEKRLQDAKGLIDTWVARHREFTDYQGPDRSMHRNVHNGVADRYNTALQKQIEDLITKLDIKTMPRTGPVISQLLVLLDRLETLPNGTRPANYKELCGIQDADKSRLLAWNTATSAARAAHTRCGGLREQYRDDSGTRSLRDVSNRAGEVQLDFPTSAQQKRVFEAIGDTVELHPDVDVDAAIDRIGAYNTALTAEADALAQNGQAVIYEAMGELKGLQRSYKKEIGDLPPASQELEYGQTYTLQQVQNRITALEDAKEAKQKQHAEAVDRRYKAAEFRSASILSLYNARGIPGQQPVLTEPKGKLTEQTQALFQEAEKLGAEAKTFTRLTEAFRVGKEAVASAKLDELLAIAARFDKATEAITDVEKDATKAALLGLIIARMEVLFVQEQKAFMQGENPARATVMLGEVQERESLARAKDEAAALRDNSEQAALLLRERNIIQQREAIAKHGLRAIEDLEMRYRHGISRDELDELEEVHRTREERMLAEFATLYRQFGKEKERLEAIATAEIATQTGLASHRGGPRQKSAIPFSGSNVLEGNSREGYSDPDDDSDNDGTTSTTSTGSSQVDSGTSTQPAAVVSVGTQMGVGDDEDSYGGVKAHAKQKLRDSIATLNSAIRGISSSQEETSQAARAADPRYPALDMHRDIDPLSESRRQTTKEHRALHRSLRLLYALCGITPRDSNLANAAQELALRQNPDDVEAARRAIQADIAFIDGLLPKVVGTKRTEEEMSRIGKSLQVEDLKQRYTEMAAHFGDAGATLQQENAAAQRDAASRDVELLRQYALEENLAKREAQVRAKHLQEGSAEFVAQFLAESTSAALAADQRAQAARNAAALAEQKIQEKDRELAELRDSTATALQRAKADNEVQLDAAHAAQQQAEENEKAALREAKQLREAAQREKRFAAERTAAGLAESDARMAGMVKEQTEFLDAARQLQRDTLAQKAAADKKAADAEQRANNAESATAREKQDGATLRNLFLHTTLMKKETERRGAIMAEAFTASPPPPQPPRPTSATSDAQTQIDETSRGAAASRSLLGFGDGHHDHTRMRNVRAPFGSSLYVGAGEETDDETASVGASSSVSSIPHSIPRDVDLLYRIWERMERNFHTPRGEYGNDSAKFYTPMDTRFGVGVYEGSAGSVLDEVQREKLGDDEREFRTPRRELTPDYNDSDLDSPPSRLPRRKQQQQARHMFSAAAATSVPRTSASDWGTVQGYVGRLAREFQAQEGSMDDAIRSIGARALRDIEDRECPPSLCAYSVSAAIGTVLACLRKQATSRAAAATAALPRVMREGFIGFLQWMSTPTKASYATTVAGSGSAIWRNSWTTSDQDGDFNQTKFSRDEQISFFTTLFANDSVPLLDSGILRAIGNQERTPDQMWGLWNEQINSRNTRLTAEMMSRFNKHWDTYSRAVY